MTANKSITAARIRSARDLPPRLLAIGREIEAKATKADTYHGKAIDMVDSIKALLIEAHSYCDHDGFNAFRKRYCPSLGRSRAYELLAIASGRKSVGQIKAQGAARQARHVAKLKAAAAALRKADRPLVTDSARRFTAHVLELVLMTATAEPKTFNGAAIEADDLRKLADFLIAVADLHRPEHKLRLVK